MNDAKIYVPFSFFTLLCIVYLALSVPSFCLIIHFPRFLYFAAVLAFATGAMVYRHYRSQYDFENLYTLTALSILCSFVIWLAFITFFNMQYTTKNCETTSYKVVAYEGRYTSGLGVSEKSKIKANQWKLSVRKDGKIETFVLHQDISTDNRVTKRMELEFCKGILGTEYLNLEQISR